MSIITTIVPVFIVILTGLAARRRGFFSTEFTNQANRLVYNIAIPAMVFSAIAKTDLKSQMNITVIFIGMGTIFIMAGIAWVVRRAADIGEESCGSFIQCAFHGNMGYIGFAIVFYYLGEEGLAKAAIITSFIMILQNVFGILVLQYYAKKAGGLSVLETLRKAVFNPVILSAIAGIVASLSNLEIPLVLDRSLAIIKGMALPMALLIIGATLSFQQFKSKMKPILFSSFLKLMVMPAVALAFFYVSPVTRTDYLPGLIVLAAPSATVSYVLAKEIGGDPEMAGAAISFSTLMSALTFTFWLGLA